MLTSNQVCSLSVAKPSDPQLAYDTRCQAVCSITFMSQKIDSESKTQSVQWTKKVLFGLGSVFVIVGIVRQWPILGKTYLEFIEGQGYLSLMLGLIMIVLGFTVPLLIGDEEDS